MPLEEGKKGGGNSLNFIVAFFYKIVKMLIFSRKQMQIQQKLLHLFAAEKKYSSGHGSVGPRIEGCRETNKDLL